MKNLEVKLEHKTSSKYQYLAVLVVNIYVFCYGMTIGWTSPSLMVLKSDETPLPTGKVTMDEASWIASLVNMGGSTGIFFFGWINKRFGRKNPLIITTVPTIICWLLALYPQNVYYLYAARFFNGFISAGVFIMIPLFFSEIANDNIRGLLGSTIVLIFNIGMLLAFIIGNYCDFFVMPKVAIALLTLCGILFMFFPESPNALIRQNKIAEAENSLRFYRNMRGSSYNEQIEQEINKLKSAINGNEAGKSKVKSMKWSDILSGPGRRAMTIGIVVALLSRFCGCSALQTYTASIFEEAGSNLSPNMATIVVGVIQLFGSYASTFLVERAGRKILFIISAIGTALGLSTLGVYMLLKSWNYDTDAVNWIPLASVSFTIFIASWAVLALPYIVIFEIMPENVKDFGVSFCSFLIWFSSFLTTKYLPLMNEVFGFHGSMFFFASFVLICVIYIILYLPETKGKSHEEIMKLLQ